MTAKAMKHKQFMVDNGAECAELVGYDMVHQGWCYHLRQHFDSVSGFFT